MEIMIKYCHSPLMRPANQVWYVTSHVLYNGENEIIGRRFPPDEAYDPKLLLIIYVAKQLPLGTKRGELAC